MALTRKGGGLFCVCGMWIVRVVASQEPFEWRTCAYRPLFDLKL